MHTIVDLRMVYVIFNNTLKGMYLTSGVGTPCSTILNMRQENK